MCLRAQVVAAARSLMQSGGVKSVLVTLSERGAVLVQGGASGGSGAGSGGGDTTVLSQPALSVPGGVVVDGTAAGAAAGVNLQAVCLCNLGRLAGGTCTLADLWHARITLLVL